MLKKIGIVELLLILITLAVVVQHRPFAGDPGVGWHLKSGEIIASEQTLIYQDPFLNPAPESEWVHNQWLSDLVLWIVYRVGGWPALDLLTIITFLSAYFFVLAPMLRLVGIAEMSVLSILLLALLSGSAQWILRPVLFSFLFFAIVYRLLWTW